MVDTLAPKKVFSQRDLDRSLIQPTPVGRSIMAPATNVLDASPEVTTQRSLTDTPQPDYVVDKNQIFNMMQNLQKASRSRVAETRETVRSSEETREAKQTGMRAERQETPQGEGLVMRPMEYAADGVKDKKVSGPILVGEKGAELVVPTGDGKVSILDAKTTSGLMMPGSVRMSRTQAVQAMTSDDAFKSKAYQDNDFINYMKQVENNRLLAGDMSKMRHDSVEGGNQTIAFGHKLTDKERDSGKVYGYDIDKLTIKQANDILQRDLEKAYKNLVKDHGKKFTQLDSKRQQMLLDFQYNLGGLAKFPKFRDAVFGNDTETMMKEYKRFFKDPKSGEMKSLGRNKDFNKFFFDGMAKASLVTKPVRKAEKGAKNVEIGRAEPAGFLFRNPMTPDKPSGSEKLFNFLFGDNVMPLDKKEEPSLVSPPKNNPVNLSDSAKEEEPFNPSKLLDPDAVSGLDIDYFYDNLDKMVDYSIKQKKGKDYTPTPEEKANERQDLMDRYDALFDLQLSDTKEEIEEKQFNERFKKDRDPNFTIEV
jgi:hypothetical protein